MSDEYTPTTKEVRTIYGDHPDADTESEADFDRWLAKHDAEVKAETLQEAANLYMILDAMDKHIFNGTEDEEDTDD